jgi:four helix bundle protein
MKSFEDLLVWQKSLELAVQLCQMQETKSDLQFRAEIVLAACGIPAHIANATSAGTSDAFAAALDTPVSTAFRLETLIKVGADLGFIPANAHATLEARAEEVRKMLVALRASAQRGEAGPTRRRARARTSPS